MMMSKLNSLKMVSINHKSILMSGSLKIDHHSNAGTLRSQKVLGGSVTKAFSSNVSEDKDAEINPVEDAKMSTDEGFGESLQDLKYVDEPIEEPYARGSDEEGI
jgi:hypothetical protein